MVNILVTGRLGATGSLSARAVDENSYTPVVFDSGYDRDLVSDINVETVGGSVTSLPELTEAIRTYGVDWVFDTGALISPEFAQCKVDIDVEAGKNVIEEYVYRARRLGLRGGIQ